MIFTYLCVVTFLGNDMNRVASKGASIIKEWTYKYIDSVSSCILCLFFFFSLKKIYFQLQTTLLFQTPIRLLTGSQFPKSVPDN